MSKSLKRTSEAYASDDGFVEDDTTTAGDQPSSKRAKKSNSKPSDIKPASSLNATTAPSKDDNGDTFFSLNPASTRRLTVNEFKGMTMISIREFYEKDGKKMPGKKGISLTVEQWAVLVECLPGVERELAGRGENVRRPIYGDVPDKVDGTGNEKMDVASGGDEEEVKKNFEATSEEDEG